MPVAWRDVWSAWPVVCGCQRRRTARSWPSRLPTTSRESGLAGTLIEQLMLAADAQGIARFELEVLAENSGMRALAERFGGISERQDDGGMLHYRLPVQGVPAQDGGGADALEPDAWAWLEPHEVLGAMHQDWLDTSHQAFRLGQDFVEELWQSVWDSWHPAPSGQTRQRTSEPA